MPPLRPPGVGEPTVPMTRSASAERVFRFRCRGFDTPPVPMLSATGLVLSAPVPMLSAPVRPFAVRSVRPFAPCSPVSLPRARPFLCSPYPPVAVYPHAVRACSFCAAHAARRRLSLRCPCQFVPRCPGTSIPAQPVATHSLLPVPVGPRTARRLSTCFRCGGIRSGGSGVSAAASARRPVVLYIRCGRKQQRINDGAAARSAKTGLLRDRRLRGVSFPNGRSFLPETIFLR